MAVSITLWALSKRLNSMMRPGGAGVALSGTIKEPCSMLTPEITVNFDPTAYNYFRVAQWGRFYWITDITHDRGLFIIRGRIDPLASWYDEIANSFQYVLRSSSSSNGEVVDTFYPAKANGNTKNALASMGYTNVGTYVIGIAGSGTSGSTGGGTVYYELSPSQMNSFVSFLYTDTNYGVAGAALEETVKYYFNPLQYVVSCMWFPFSLGGDSSEPIRLGWWSIGMSANRAYLYHTPGQVAITVPKHPYTINAPEKAYLNAEPFSHYRLYVPGAGEITLNSNVMAQLSTIYINTVIDTITGRAFYEITDGTNILAKLDGQVGVPIALSQVTVNTIGAVLDTAQAAVTGIASLFTGGLVSAGGAIGNALESNQPTISRTGADGSRSIAVANANAILTMEYLTQVPDDNTDFGRPLCNRVQIRTLSGFVMCLKPHIAIAGTAEESAEIERLLAEGVYYE